ncbi:class II histone deacetylase [Primorskyibacter marinus]|uniref:class II histone deacetylase n=1 Tax=Primorskyibacter marinus TaxID=1977320 RepID=UPI000E300A4D|nr:class II histone deacetylase [Primorskyibacter marinus]
MTTGLVWDERFAWFNAGTYRQRSPLYQQLTVYDTRDSKEQIRELLVASGLVDTLVPIVPRLATDAELLRYHTPAYLAKVKALSDAGGGDAGEGAYLGPNCYDIAKLATGACLEALDAVLDGRVENAYALVRPCGHHATKDFGRGYSIFNNLVVAILHAKAQGQVSRVAVVDWDVHHGNGTQDAFYDDPSVLTISLHQDGYYPPDSGGLDEQGEGPGRGYNINVPLPPGSGHGAYLEAMQQVVVPALRRFRPEAILVASGLDANARDPLGRMMCHSQTYRDMATLIKAEAQELCQGRLLASHEGGYASLYVPWCALAIMEAFADVKTSSDDPSLSRVAVWPGQELQPHQASVISKAAELPGNIAAGRL